MSGRVITSLSNPTVKAARALHLRKEREESGLFLAEGLKIVTEAVELGRAPKILLHGAEAAAHPLLRNAALAGRCHLTLEGPQVIYVGEGLALQGRLICPSAAAVAGAQVKIVATSGP